MCATLASQDTDPMTVDAKRIFHAILLEIGQARELLIQYRNPDLTDTITLDDAGRQKPDAA